MVLWTHRCARVSLWWDNLNICNCFCVTKHVLIMTYAAANWDNTNVLAPDVVSSWIGWGKPDLHYALSRSERPRSDVSCVCVYGGGHLCHPGFNRPASHVCWARCSTKHCFCLDWATLNYWVHGVQLDFTLRWGHRSAAILQDFRHGEPDGP